MILMVHTCGTSAVVCMHFLALLLALHVTLLDDVSRTVVYDGYGEVRHSHCVGLQLADSLTA